MDKKTFHLIYSEIMALWPEVIDITERITFENGGERIESLVEAQRSVEWHLENVVFRHIGHNDQLMDWYRLIGWSIYQLLHMSLTGREKGIISVREILNESMVLRRCLENKDFIPDWIIE